ncbi:hypothetical protein [Enterococcus sp.]|uniref:hypothetical protein n=1 Tax=Enterococcus sp. TaxID=35783 RepID=UPI0028A92CA6|nr:hypothetical protein [Enterococcus sp.]
MSFIVLIGAQATGKMTVGRELEKRIDGKLLFNHQTLDIFAGYLGYIPQTFALSNQLRLDLFQSFVDNIPNNPVKSIIFTVLIYFDQAEDIAFLHQITDIFLAAREDVYFVELVTDVNVRLQRNVHPSRLQAKPSKRDLAFSESELLSAHAAHRLESQQDELENSFLGVQTLRINNTDLTPEAAAALIIEHFQLPESPHTT